MTTLSTMVIPLATIRLQSDDLTDLNFVHSDLRRSGKALDACLESVFDEFDVIVVVVIFILSSFNAT